MSLIGEVFDKEIKGVVFNIGDDKALGPVGSLLISSRRVGG